VNEMRDELMEMQSCIVSSSWDAKRPSSRLSPGILSSMPVPSRFQPRRPVHRPSGQLVLHDPRTDEFLDNSHSHSLYIYHRPFSHPSLPTEAIQSAYYLYPPSIWAEQPRSRLQNPTEDYTSPSGSVVVGQGGFSPPQSPPTTSNSGSTSAGAGAGSCAAASTRIRCRLPQGALPATSSISSMFTSNPAFRKLSTEVGELCWVLNVVDYQPDTTQTIQGRIRLENPT
jgi:hypothetical protein